MIDKQRRRRRVLSEYTHILFPLSIEQLLHFGKESIFSIVTISFLTYVRFRNSSIARFFLVCIEHLSRATSDDRLVAPAEAPVGFMRASAPYVPAIPRR